MKDLHISGDFTPGNYGSLNVEHGNPTGLYHLILGEGQNAFVGNGMANLRNSIFRFGLTFSNRPWWHQPSQCKCLLESGCGYTKHERMAKGNKR
jgi:hypothetical protein